ncbi:MAG: hypothetical protein V4538_08785 [Bacteroidota bacterium]
MTKKQTNETRNDFYKRLLYITAGILLIVSVWHKSGPERYIALAGFILAMYQLIILISTAQYIIDDYFPPRKPFERSASPFNRFIYKGSALFFFIGLVCIIFEIRQLDNTINGKQLFWYSGFLGLAIAGIITWKLKKANRGVYDESSRRITVHAGLFLGFFLFIPSAASFINHYFANPNIVCNKHIINKKETSNGRRHTSYWLYIQLDNNIEERFDVGLQLFDKVNEGEAIELCTQKGKLGYPFVDAFKPVTTDAGNIIIDTKQ